MVQDGTALSIVEVVRAKQRTLILGTCAVVLYYRSIRAHTHELILTDHLRFQRNHSTVLVSAILC